MLLWQCEILADKSKLIFSWNGMVSVLGMHVPSGTAAPMAQTRATSKGWGGRGWVGLRTCQVHWARPVELTFLPHGLQRVAPTVLEAMRRRKY